MSAAQLHDQLQALKEELSFPADPGQSPTSRPEILSLMEVVAKAMELEASNADESVDVLSHALRITSDSAAAATILNNLGCVEKRRGNPKLAVYYFERAADKECGLASACPSTLLNLSAAYSALQMFAEAAATANHAVLCCDEGYHDVRPEMHAAAYHNLATALEGSGEFFAAADAYSMALKLIEGMKGTPTHRTIERASEQLELKLRNLRARKQQEEWRRSVMPSIIRRTGKVLRTHGKLPPLRESPHPAIIGDPMTENLYTQQLRKFHAVRSLRSSPALTSSQVSTFVRRPLPPWNTDPLLSRPADASLVCPLPRSVEIERHTEEHFLPRVLCSLVEGLRYKEAMHRLAIRSEWKRRLKLFKLKMQLHYVCALEDETRATIEIEEARVWRVLMQWASGKLLFVQGSLEVERQETAARDVIVQETQEECRELNPIAKRLQLVAEEESCRCSISTEECQHRDEIENLNESSLAAIAFTDAERTSNRALAYALALWSVESSIGSEAVEQVMRPEMKNSLHVLERYVTFGIPPGLGRKETVKE